MGGKWTAWLAPGWVTEAGKVSGPLLSWGNLQAANKHLENRQLLKRFLDCQLLRNRH